MKRVKLFLMVLSLFVANLAIAQNITVTGTVTDATEKEPLLGAYVVVKGTNNGTMTDDNGKFVINNCPSNAVLAFSYIGYDNMEIPVNGKTVVNAALKSSNVLNEVVVTSGYGVAQKGTFTGAASIVKNDKLQIPATSFEKALQGNAAGVLSVSNSGQPGAGQSVTIRGIGSIQGGTSPLYVVDGVPIATGNYGNMTQTASTSTSDNINALSSLNPNDIETLVVLKDAAATSIYGSRASNGVILITTKRGASGKTQFNLKLSTGFSSRTTKNFTTLNKDEYIDYMTDARVNAGYSSATINVNGREVNEYIANAFPVRNANNDFYDFDWTKEAYNDSAPTYSIDFSARGGNEKTKFFASLSYMDQQGIVKKTDLTRYSGRITIDHQVNKKLSFTAGINLSYNNQQSPMTTSGYYINPVFAVLMYAPIDPGRIDPGSSLYVKGKLSPYAPENGINIDNMVTYANANFIANQEYDDLKSRTARAISNLSAQWEIIDGLILKGVAGLDYFYLTETDWRDPRPKGSSASYGRGTSETSVGENMVWNENVTLNYMKTFGQKHNMNLMIGQETQGSDYRNVDAIRQDFPGRNFHQLGSGATNYYVDGTRYGSNLASFFANGNYNYDHKYFLSASIRRDGSSKLSADHRWSTFWSVGGSWKITQENFAKNWNWLSSATLRASYGTTGNSSGIGNYAAQGLYGAGSNYGGEAGIYPSQIANPNLGWETSEAFNIGLDFSFLNGRLGGTVEWYNRNTKDLLLNMPLSYTSGFDKIISNVGAINNKGIELSINANPIQTKNFRWDIDFNITHNKNKVTKLVSDSPIDSAPWRYQVGYDIQTFYTRPWAGVNPADGRPMYYDQNGEIIYTTSGYGELRQMGASAAPKFYGGLTTRFSFYSVDLSLMFYYTYGGKIYDGSWSSATSLGNQGVYNQHSSVATERWRKEGDIVQYPKAYFNYVSADYGIATDRLIYDGSYIRLRDITIGYSLPKKWIDAIGFTGIRIYGQGSNLFTISSFPDADPEVGRSGYYYLGYPNAKTFTFGIDIKF